MKDSSAKAWLRALESIKIMQERPSLTLPLLVREMAVTQGERPALLGERETLSYQALAKRVDHYARWAGSQQIAPGEVVGLLMPNCPDYPCIWLGITQTGGVVALLNNQLRGAALLHCIKTAGCRHVIADASLLDAILDAREKSSGALKIWVHGEGAWEFPRIDVADAPALPVELQNPQPGLKDLALLIYTSGTTGLPKAAKVTHGRVMEWSSWFAGMMNVTPDDRLFNCLPLYHSTGGVVAIGSMLVRGGSVVIREKFSASRFWDDVIQSQATIFQYIGELCRYLILTDSHPRETEHSLRLICGNGMRGDVWTALQERFKIPRVLEFYAATEGNLSLYNCDGKPGAIGRVPPFLNHRFPVALVRCDMLTGEILRDENGHCIPCAADEPGEALGKILQTTESQFDGYTDATASAAKTLHNVHEDGDLWFRTGDLMRKDSAGYYYFVDRLGDSFRWKGENVSTAEVAERLSACPGIQEAAVFGVAVPGNEGKAGMAAITIGPDFSWSNFQAFLKRELPVYARPVFIRCCQSLEATGTFKTKKHALQCQGYLHATEPVWVFDTATETFVACDESRLAWIASGGVGRKMRLEGQGAGVLLGISA